MKKINYPRKTISHKIGDKLYILEVIRDLDEAIDLICESMSEEEKLDPFAEDLCPYFGVLWPAGIGLAHFIQDHPHLVQGKRVLELGAGLGLPSLVSIHLGAHVLTTDFHPEVEEYFLRNCRHSSLKGNYQRLNWRSEDELGQKYDVVMGSDVLYESQHPKEVAKGLTRFLNKKGTILLSDPGRNYLKSFLEAIRAQAMSIRQSNYEAEGKAITILEINEETE